MTPGAEELFEAARALKNPPQQQAFLDAACHNQPALRQELEELLALQGEADQLLEPGAAALDPDGHRLGPLPSALDPSARVTEQPGDCIGRYKLREKIGEGGCGVVYVADQEEPVRRRVALKVIKLGMDTKSVIARFEAERQALAMMDHPSIAKVLDAGATETGRPYFVMELVRGVKITDYCDENKLGTQQRLELFIKVCQAVQHAHQKAIIHRDLKPSNILVTLNDGVAVPKIIDFGIVKATEGRLTDLTVYTGLHQLIGTPTYMSPEQALMSSVDIDTRSDIYSLGVLLYELLVGRTPFDTKELTQAGLEEMRRTIREKEPLRPSTRLSTLAPADLDTAAKARGTEAPRLRSQLQGDLDWIVMKCLEKDRARRYETANGLAMDIKRHLANEPVVARPPSAFYQFQKMVHRHKVGFSAGAVVLVVLLIGLSLSSWLLIRTSAAEREQARLRHQAERAESQKTQELGKALLAFARATRQSGEPGRRFASLEAITKAAAIRPSLELRNEAIAALALTDLGRPQIWRAAVFTPNWRWEYNYDFDASLERYAIGRPDKAISICRVADQHELFRIPPASAEGRCLSFSPDGKWLAVRHDDGWLRAWDLERRVNTVTVKLDVSLRWSLDFTPDNRCVVAGSTTNLVRWFDLATGLETNSLPVSIAPAHLLLHPAGKVLAIHDGTRCELWDWEQRKLLRTLSPPLGPPKPWAPAGPFTAWAWHPDEIRFASGSDSQEIYLWDTSTGNYLSLHPPSGYVARLFFSPRGDMLVSYGWDSTTRIWDAQTGEPMFSTEGGYAWRFSRDGQRLAFFRDNGEFGVWPVVSPRIFRTLNTRVPDARGQRVVYGGCSFSPDGRFLVWGQDDGLRWVDMVSGRLGYQALASARVCAFHPDGASLLTFSGEGVLSWPVLRATNAVALTLRLGPPTPMQTASGQIMKRCAISRDGQTIVGGDTNRWIVAESGVERVMKYPTQFDSDNGFVLSPDTRWVGLGFWGASAFVCNARTGEPVKEFPDVQGGILDFTPDGRWLVTCSAQEYRFWETDTWQPGRIIRRQVASQASGAIAFGLDGNLMAIARTAYSVQLLNPNSGEVLADLNAPNLLQVHKLCFSPDGSVLAVTGIQGIHLWDLRALRQELAALHLDWPQPPYPISTNSLADVVFRYVSEKE